MDVEAIARGLTKAQRRALLDIPVARPFTPAYFGQWPCLSCLKSKNLIRAMLNDMGGWGKDAQHKITDTGIAVRAWLEGNG
jgi:hypothetical protein